MTEPVPPQPPPRPSLVQRMKLPQVSGKWTVFWLLCCFVLTGVLIPLVLKLPRWVEFEFVVGAWWVLWSIILTKLLYKGEQIPHDHQLKEPRDWFGLKKSSSSKWDPGCAAGSDFEGCAVLLGLIVALVLVWFLIEIAIPIVFFMLYFLIRGMLARVVNDRPRCRGNFGLSAARGIFWATIYTAPLAGTVWLIHWIRVKQGG